MKIPNIATLIVVSLAGLPALGACSSGKSASGPPADTNAVMTDVTCANPGGAEPGAADTHCVGMTPQPVSQAACFVSDSGAAATAEDDAAGSTQGDAAGSAQTDAASPQPGPCGENGGDFGTTMYGSEGDDDDCKYHVSFTVDGEICDSGGFYFIVTASYLTQGGAPLTGAAPYAEVCWNQDDTHVPPNADFPYPAGSQQVMENPPGTYKIGPIVLDEPGTWTVRFHFNEECYDVLPDSPHGHAAFFIDVPAPPDAGQSVAGDGASGSDANAGNVADSGMCGAAVPQACPSPMPSYQTQIAPLLQTYCITCHSPDGAAGFDESTYATVNAQLSPILDQVAACQMPPVGSPELPPSDRLTLLDWLVCGGPDN